MLRGGGGDVSHIPLSSSPGTTTVYRHQYWCTTAVAAPTRAVQMTTFISLKQMIILFYYNIGPKGYKKL